MRDSGERDIFQKALWISATEMKHHTYEYLCIIVPNICTLLACTNPLLQFVATYCTGVSFESECVGVEQPVPQWGWPTQQLLDLGSLC